MEVEPRRDVATHPLGPWLQPLRRAIAVSLAYAPPWLAELVLFGLKMAWSCLFGALMLAALLLTHWFWPVHAAVRRYDLLFVIAVTLQGLMLAFRLETFEELKVILLYHLIGTVMELFKTGMGSWSYPEAAVIRLAGVPLFSGFMYGCVGSFIARVMKVCEMRFDHYPARWVTWLLSALIYMNFFTHHWAPDIRWALFAGAAAVFWRTRIWFRVMHAHRSMPFLICALLTAGFMWLAETIGVFSHTWLYPQSGAGWRLVPVAKFGAWFLLLIISFVCVALVAPLRPRDGSELPA